MLDVEDGNLLLEEILPSAPGVSPAYWDITLSFESRLELYRSIAAQTMGEWDDREYKTFRVIKRSGEVARMCRAKSA